MRWFVVSAILALFRVANGQSVVVGDVRLQFLSSRLIRLEVRGPNGFEDRPTFHVVNRDWKLLRATKADSGDSTLVSAGGWRVFAPSSAKDLSGIKIASRDGETVFDGTTKVTNSEWLPSPAKMPKAWAIADNPRIIPPAWGATPSTTNDANSGWDLGNDASDIYVFLPDGNYRALRSDFLALTGRTEMPPLYAFGLIDSKYYQYTEASALATIDKFREKQIPLDVFVVDTDWRIGASHGYAPDPKYFPDMPRFLTAAKSRNVRIMFNDHPEPQAATALDPMEMRYRYDGLSTLLLQGVDVWWYDRNWSTHLKEPLPGLRAEAWGMRLFHDITLKTFPERRPLIMANVDGIDNGFRNRPPNIATHRFPIQWTGDTGARWSYLRKGVENVVHGGVHAAFPYISEDLAGHWGSPERDFYVRFMEFGALSPVMRPHCTRGETREPWDYGEEAEKIVKRYVELRYRLLPVFYTAAHENYLTGEPLLRRLDLEYPQFAEAARDDQYLLGHDLLVAPIIGIDAAPVPSSLFADGLQAEYFGNTKLQGDSIKRKEAAIDFGWGEKSPDASIPSDGFSARWTGKLGPVPGKDPMVLKVLGDDGVRMWIDGVLVVDSWRPQDSAVATASMILQPGKIYEIKLEYYEGGGNAACRLLWESATRTSLDSREVWIPPGKWCDLWTGDVFDGPKLMEVSATLPQIPMLVRVGGIVALAPAMQYSGAKPWTPITLEVFAGASGSTVLYEDDGISNEYQSGKFRETNIRSKMGQQSTILEIGAAKGGYKGAIEERGWKVRVHTLGRIATAVQVNGRDTSWSLLPRMGSVAIPLLGDGSSRDGDVVEVSLPVTSVGRKQTVEVVWR